MSCFSSACRTFHVGVNLTVVGNDGEHQGLEVLVLDFVLEDVDFAGAEEFGAGFVEGLGDQQLKSKSVCVVRLGLLLGAFTLGHGERSDPQLEGAAVREVDGLFDGLQVGGLTKAVNGADWNGHTTRMLMLLV